MQIGSIVDIVNGELKNSPLISYVTDIKINPHKIKQGDLFLVQNPQEIEIAIQQGAFAILYDNQDINPSDLEIAWIYVEDIHYAMIRLMRYILSLHKLEIYLCDTITQNLIKTFATDFEHPIILLKNNMYENIIALNQIEEFSLVFANNEQFLSKISPNYQEFNKSDYSISNQTIHSAFETTFSYNNHYISKLKLPAIYIKQFLDIYTYLHTNIEISKLKASPLCKPIFINQKCQIIEFGKSEKFILAIKEQSIAQKQIEFFKSIYKYSIVEVINQEDNEMILQTIKNKRFNILIVLGRSYDQMIQIISEPKKEHTLF
ncbi:MAG: hypothetical protein U9N30_05605 [Campylobacterota bacterium]|nr:hypothetical protein [Campylobacterota bacterium]